LKREQIESTPWAQAFRLDSPVSYQAAIRYALEPRLEVILDHNNENGEWVWAIRVFDYPEFWMDAVPTKKAARELCRAMGWRIKS
jgi:hypothetical protein